MNTYESNTPVTVGILKEVVPEIIKEVMPAILGEYTEEVVLPAVREIVKDEVQKEIGEFRTEIKDYMDGKLNSLRGDLISVMKGEHDRDRSWKKKILDIIKRNKLAPDDEIDLLGELAR